MRTETWICDIKGCTNGADHKDIVIQTIFTTEQTEGRSVKPYLSNERIDICQSCLDVILKDNHVWASGAQGYNEYYFKNKS